MTADHPYNAPSVTELGDFAAETGMDVGDQFEPSWPMTGRP
ncbi:hypothetical protein [Nonomuraea candida]|nr:hypothetical protein [Nonomuraea candida]